MVAYICKLCNKEFVKKCNFDYHMNKKRPCINIIIEQPKKFNTNIPITDMFVNENVDMFDAQNKQNNECVYCNTKFSRLDSLQRHLKDRCKSKKYYNELEIVKEKLKIITEKNVQYIKNNFSSKSSNNFENSEYTTMNNINQVNNGLIINNNNLNVKLVQFGNENLDNIDIKEALDVYLKSTGGNIVSNILKLINFNEKYPENHNICMTDLSRELVKYFNGKKFVIKKFKNVKNDILNHVVKNTLKIVDKIETDDTIKKTSNVKSKMKINNASVRLIKGDSAEDIVMTEIKNENIDMLEDEDEEIELSFEQLLRIEHLEGKQKGLLEIALERIKEELCDGKIIVCN